MTVQILPLRGDLPCTRCKDFVQLCCSVNHAKEEKVIGRVSEARQNIRQKKICSTSPPETVAEFEKRSFKMVRPVIVLRESDLKKYSRVKRLKVATLKKLHTMVVPHETVPGATETVYVFNNPDRPFREGFINVGAGEKSEVHSLHTDMHKYPGQGSNYLQHSTKKRKDAAAELDLGPGSRTKLLDLHTCIDMLKNSGAASSDGEESASEDEEVPCLMDVEPCGSRSGVAAGSAMSVMHTQLLGGRLPWLAINQLGQKNAEGISDPHVGDTRGDGPASPSPACSPRNAPSPPPSTRKNASTFYDGRDGGDGGDGSGKDEEDTDEPDSDDDEGSLNKQKLVRLLKLG